MRYGKTFVTQYAFSVTFRKRSIALNITLLRKLKHNGLFTNALNQLSSYLSYRIQLLFLNRTQLNGAAVKLGVPQGSILPIFQLLVTFVVIKSV
jgi:hypothetical protein